MSQPSFRYRVTEKPPKFVEKGNLEAHLFQIHTQLRTQSRANWMPPEDKELATINARWAVLDSTEFVFFSPVCVFFFFLFFFGFRFW